VKSLQVILAAMPKDIAASALVVGDEAAWKRDDCGVAIDWFRNHGHAILGIELWIPKGDGIRTTVANPDGPVIYVTSCDPDKGESWSDYVRRSADAADAAIKEFRLEENSAHSEINVFFNLTWADLEWFRLRGQFRD
jgi:hypothetical protein